MQSEENIQNIPTEAILDPRTLLRPVLKEDVSYLEMRDSVAEHGYFNSICVRPAGRRATPTQPWECVDGLWRLSVGRDLGKATVPCIIKDLTDLEALAFQVQANAVTHKTTRIEYAKQLKRIKKAKPGITLAELAVLVKKRPHWVKEQLDLLTLGKSVQRLVDRGEIPIQSAYMLAKIPRFQRAELVPHACTMKAPEFRALAAGIIKRFAEDIRQGKLDEQFNDRPFEPQAHLRLLKEVQRESQLATHGPNTVVAENAKTPLEGWMLCLRWVLHLDRDSVEEQRKRAEGKRHQDLRTEFDEMERDHEVDDDESTPDE